MQLTYLSDLVKGRLMLQQMQESMLHQIMHVRVANDTQTIRSCDWYK